MAQFEVLAMRGGDPETMRLTRTGAIDIDREAREARDRRSVRKSMTT